MFVTLTWANVAHTALTATDDEGIVRHIPADPLNADYAGILAANLEIAEPTLTLAEQIAAIQSRRTRAILAFTYGGHAIPLTDETQRDVGNAVQALARQAAGTTIPWEIVSGVYVDMTLTDVQALGDVAFAHVQACYANSKTLTEAAQASQSYDLESGWPS